jgi:hypothetical protein
MIMLVKAPLKLVVQGLVVMALALLDPTFAAAAPKPKTKQISISYVKPKNPEHEPLYALLVERRFLEKKQEILGPFRLPRTLPLVIRGCDGNANARYDGSGITLCYEFIEEVWKNAPSETTPEGVTPTDAIVGSLANIFFHEVGHALFDLLQVPVLGREEDAADTVSALIMLFIAKEEGRRIIEGAAYMYKDDLKKDVSLKLSEFSDVHSTPQQRFFNLLCIAYGANQELFSELVKKGYLPEDRAVGCRNEAQVAFFAFNRLIMPHIDKDLARQVHAKQWLPPVNRPLPRYLGAPKSSATNDRTP